MWLCVKWFDSRVDDSQVGKFLLQNTGWSLLHIKVFQCLGHLANQKKGTGHITQYTLCTTQTRICPIKTKKVLICGVVIIWWMTQVHASMQLLCMYNNVPPEHHHPHPPPPPPPDLFIVGHCLDMGAGCNQSHISWRNLGWQLSMKIKVNVK